MLDLLFPGYRRNDGSMEKSPFLSKAGICLIPGSETVPGGRLRHASSAQAGAEHGSDIALGLDRLDRLERAGVCRKRTFFGK